MKPIRNKSFSRKKITFITGTNTGVGKTLLTALLLAFLREKGYQALAIKPFCTGSLDDFRLLNALQDQALTVEEACPFFFPEPTAPLVGARYHRRQIPLQAVISRIKKQAMRCDLLLVEGIGGVMVPLGPGYSVLDLITRLNPLVLVAAPNQLGVLNQVLLTARALQHAGNESVIYVLMEQNEPDFSARTNAKILEQLLAPSPVVSLPFLGAGLQQPERVKIISIKIQKTLASLWKIGSVCARRATE